MSNISGYFLHKYPFQLHSVFSWYLSSFLFNNLFWYFNIFLFFHVFLRLIALLSKRRPLGLLSFPLRVVLKCLTHFSLLINSHVCVCCTSTLVHCVFFSFLCTGVTIPFPWWSGRPSRFHIPLMVSVKHLWVFPPQLFMISMVFRLIVPNFWLTFSVFVLQHLSVLLFFLLCCFHIWVFPSFCLE